jgi:Fe-S oxidoreductase
VDADLPDARAALDPTGELTDIAGDCVHCGFCLPACPTYQLWGEEMDSPRGRIHLISQLLDGAQAGDAAAAHLDRCLGCMACVPACPSGVRYDRLIEAARSWAAEPVTSLPPRSPRERALRTAISTSESSGIAASSSRGSLVIRWAWARWQASW